MIENFIKFILLRSTFTTGLGGRVQLPLGRWQNITRLNFLFLTKCAHHEKMINNKLIFVIYLRLQNFVMLQLQFMSFDMFLFSKKRTVLICHPIHILVWTQTYAIVQSFFFSRSKLHCVPAIILSLFSLLFRVGLPTIASSVILEFCSN